MTQNFRLALDIDGRKPVAIHCKDGGFRIVIHMLGKPALTVYGFAGARGDCEVVADGDSQPRIIVSSQK